MQCRDDVAHMFVPSCDATDRVWVVHVVVGNARKAMNRRSTIYTQLQKDRARFRKSEGVVVTYADRMEEDLLADLPVEWKGLLSADWFATPDTRKSPSHIVPRCVDCPPSVLFS
jgi:hypothetical protein